MTGFLVRWGDGHYLQWHPAPKVYEFTAAEPRFATVFTREDAERHAAEQLAAGRVAVIEPDLGREPKSV